MEDSAIIDLYWQRSEEAITETTKKYGRYCYTIAFNILDNREDAEDCLNDTYLGAWNSMPPHRPNILAVFLGRITRGLALTLIRNNQRKKRGGKEIALVYEELSFCVDKNEDLEQQVFGKELSQIIAEFTHRLSETERNVFICRYWYFDPIKGICNRYGYSESKVKSILQRTRDKLKEHLIKEGY